MLSAQEKRRERQTAGSGSYLRGKGTPGPGVAHPTNDPPVGRGESSSKESKTGAERRGRHTHTHTHTHTHP